MDSILQFLGLQQPQGLIPKPKQKTLEDYGWVKGFDNVYRQPKPSPILSPKPVSSADPTNIDWLEKQVLPITRKAGLPDPLVAGQWAIEGRKKNTAMFNLLFNGKPHTYQNIENNVNDYILTINNILKSKGYDINQIKDPEQILKILQTGTRRYEGHSKNPMDYVKIVPQTPEYRYYLK